MFTKKDGVRAVAKEVLSSMLLESNISEEMYRSILNSIKYYDEDQLESSRDFVHLAGVFEVETYILDNYTYPDPVLEVIFALLPLIYSYNELSTICEEYILSRYDICSNITRNMGSNKYITCLLESLSFETNFVSYLKDLINCRDTVLNLIYNTKELPLLTTATTETPKTKPAESKPVETIIDSEEILPTRENVDTTNQKSTDENNNDQKTKYSNVVEYTDGRYDVSVGWNKFEDIIKKLNLFVTYDQVEIPDCYNSAERFIYMANIYKDEKYTDKINSILIDPNVIYKSGFNLLCNSSDYPDDWYTAVVVNINDFKLVKKLIFSNLKSRTRLAMHERSISDLIWFVDYSISPRDFTYDEFMEITKNAHNAIVRTGDKKVRKLPIASMFISDYKDPKHFTLKSKEGLLESQKVINVNFK